MINAQEPDLILITGDFLTEREHLSDLLFVLKKLKATMGIYGVIGDNDEHVIDTAQFKTILESIGIHI